MNLDIAPEEPTEDRDEDNWLPDLQGEGYLEFLHRMHLVLKPRTYLEIGSRTGNSLALAACSSIAIDPEFNLNDDFFGSKPACFLYRMTSDGYFEAQNPAKIFGRKIDFAFLDGLHLAEFLLRDFANTEKYCYPHSVIAIHDCIPLDRMMTERDEEVAIKNSSPSHPMWWTGDVWMTIEALKKYRPDLKIIAVDAPPTGLILITGLNSESQIIKEKYTEIEKSFSQTQISKARYINYIKSLNLMSTRSFQTHYDFANHLYRSATNEYAIKP